MYRLRFMCKAENQSGAKKRKENEVKHMTLATRLSAKDA